MCHAAAGPDAAGRAACSCASATSASTGATERRGTPADRRRLRCRTGMRTGFSPPVPVSGISAPWITTAAIRIGAVDDLQPRRVDLEVRQQVLQQVDRERAEDDADQPAAAARERRAAEHDALRSRAARTASTSSRVRRLHERGQREAADAGEEAAEPVARDAHGRHVDAGREGGRVVRADREEQAAERHVLERDPDQQRCADREERAGNRSDRAGEVVDPAMALAERHGVRAPAAGRRPAARSTSRA